MLRASYSGCGARSGRNGARAELVRFPQLRLRFELGGSELSVKSLALPRSCRHEHLQIETYLSSARQYQAACKVCLRFLGFRRDLERTYRRRYASGIC